MQQLKVEHKKTIVKTTREGKGRTIAQSRRIYRLQNTDVFYVESESSDNTYYYVKLKFDVLEYCSCPDNSIRGQTCKHLHAVEHAIKLGIVKDVEKLPSDAKRGAKESDEMIEAISYQSYRDGDQYDF